jgi:hypothetical protein
MVQHYWVWFGGGGEVEYINLGLYLCSQERGGGGVLQLGLPLGTNSNLKNMAFKRQNNLESAHGPTSPLPLSTLTPAPKFSS